MSDPSCGKASHGPGWVSHTRLRKTVQDEHEIVFSRASQGKAKKTCPHTCENMEASQATQSQGDGDQGRVSVGEPEPPEVALAGPLQGSGNLDPL